MNLHPLGPVQGASRYLKSHGGQTILFAIRLVALRGVS